MNIREMYFYLFGFALGITVSLVIFNHILELLGFYFVFATSIIIAIIIKYYIPEQKKIKRNKL